MESYNNYIAIVKKLEDLETELKQVFGDYHQQIQIMDEVYNIGANPNTGHPLLDALLFNVITLGSYETHSGIVMHTDVKSAKYGWYSNMLNTKIYSGGWNMKLLKSIIDNKYEKLCPSLHPEYISYCATIAYVSNLKAIHSDSHIHEFESQIKDLKENIAMLHRENEMLKDKVSLLEEAIGLDIKYDYDEIRSRIEPFCDELLLTQRIFARILRGRYSLPIAIPVAEK